MTPDLLARVRAWSYRRQLLHSRADQPLDALRSVLGAYSSHPTAPLALLARTNGLDSARFLDMEQSRQAVRLPAMRGSIFLVPAEYAARVFAATRVPLESRTKNLEYAGVDLESYQELKPRLLELTREPVSPKALEAQVQSGMLMSVVLRTMSREGLILRVGTSPRSENWLYVSTEAWLGAPLQEVEREEALRWLAVEYLRAYGPARIKDLAWWLSLTQRQATETLAGADLVDVDDGLLLLSSDAGAFEAVDPLGDDDVAVLPKWDSYTMAYAPDGRARLVAGEHLRLAYTVKDRRNGATFGDGVPLLLRAGVAVAT